MQQNYHYFNKQLIYAFFNLSYTDGVLQGAILHLIPIALFKQNQRINYDTLMEFHKVQLLILFQLKSIHHSMTSLFKTVFFVGKLYFPLTLTLTSSKIGHLIFLCVKIVGIRKQNDNRKLMSCYVKMFIT